MTAPQESTGPSILQTEQQESCPRAGHRETTRRNVWWDEADSNQEREKKVEETVTFGPRGAEVNGHPLAILGE
jgi:hypothetical protein